MNDVSVPEDAATQDSNPLPGVQRWLISCDESGMDGAAYYGFGALWMPWQRRGDFAGLVGELKERHGYTSEIKWTNVRPHYARFYRDLVEMFFHTKWLTFHCMVIRRAIIRKSLHNGDIDLARRKHFTKLLTNKISRCIKSNPGRKQTFRIWVDPIASRYKRADEALEVIANRAVEKALGEVRAVDKVLTRNSKDAYAIQLCDLLLGAVLAAWRQEASASVKIELQKWISHYLGWPDLRSDTHNSERKFNIWYFYDPTLGPRELTTRQVRLVYPLPRKTSATILKPRALVIRSAR